MERTLAIEPTYFEDIETDLPDYPWGAPDIWSAIDTGKSRPAAYIVVPTCSCDYVRWVVKDEGFKFPYLGNELYPTKCIEELCQYCGHYVCWVRVGVKNFESKSLPLWANESYFSEVLEKTWFTQYIEAVERVKANRKLDQSGQRTDTL